MLSTQLVSYSLIVPDSPVALSCVCNLSCRAGKLSVVPMDDRSDTVHILLRQAKGQQLWLDFGMTLTAAPRGFKPNQMVNVTGSMNSGMCASQTLQTISIVTPIPILAPARLYRPQVSFILYQHFYAFHDFVVWTYNAGTNTLHVTNIVPSAASYSTQRVWSGYGATAAPSTLSTLLVQVTFCGITPSFNLQVCADHYSCPMPRLLWAQA